MAEYIVSIDNEETNRNADNLSLTGRVNGVNCSAVIRLSGVEAAVPDQRKGLKQRALVQAYLARAAQPPSGSGELVTV